MNIAIYARVSSETQSKEGTIQSQLEALREYAQQHELTIIHECMDDGYSGAELNRPGLDHLRDLAYEGLIEGILILSPDRLSRKQAHQIILLEEFKKHNIQIIFTNQQFGDTPEDNLMLQIQGAISEYERAKINDRMRRGRKYAVKKGQVLGNNAPYGYHHVRKTESKPAHWEIDPREAEIVRLVFDLYINKRMTGPAITKYLEAEGIPGRSNYNKWYSSTIYSILNNETYLGTAYMFKHRVSEPGKHPKVQKYRRHKNSSKTARPREDWIGIPVTPIIDQETWDKAQRLLQQNAKKSPRNNTKNNYLLRGLVVCGLCGSMAPGHVSNRKTYYSCGAKRNKNVTIIPHDENIIVRQTAFDEKVWSGLVTLLNDPENMKAQLEKRLERKNSQIAPVTMDDNNIDHDLEKLDIQERRVLDAYREGIIDLDELKDQKAKLSVKRKVLEAKKKAILGHLESPGQGEITFSMLGDVSALFSRAMKKANFEKRQKLANFLINSVTLYQDRATVKGKIPVIRGDVLNPSNFNPRDSKRHKARRGLSPRRVIFL